MVQRADVRVDQAKLEAQAAPIIKRQVNKIAREIRNDAQRIVPTRTGRLKHSITAQRAKVLRPLHVEASVTANTRYAVFVHEGTRAHVIRARRAKALHFVWHGREVFFTSVHHPGTRANPFLAIAGRRVATRYRGTR